MQFFVKTVKKDSFFLQNNELTHFSFLVVFPPLCFRGILNEDLITKDRQAEPYH